jgi:hypothetical protein
LPFLVCTTTVYFATSHLRMSSANSNQPCNQE